MIVNITSKENKVVKHAYSLKNNKYREQYNEFLAEGQKILKMALETNLVKYVFLKKPDYTLPYDITQYIVNDDIIDKLTSYKNPEGVIFVSSYPSNYIKKMDRVLYLDDINDPGNMGTIIRTALAFDYDAVIYSSSSCDPFNEKVIAASKGAIFKMPLICDDLYKIITNQKLVVSALTDNSINLNNLKVKEPFILVLGNEAHGVKDDIIKKADYVVKIPISNIDSLNVSIAAGILMNHLR